MDTPLTPRWATLDTEGNLAIWGTEPTLEALQAAVGGDIEQLPGPGGLNVIVLANEKRVDRDGNHLLLNPKASAWLQPVLWPGTTIVGTIAITGPADEQGNTLDLPAEATARLLEKFG